MTATHRLAVSLLLSLVCIFSTANFALAQATDNTRGQLTVTVVDSTGATVADASVVATRGSDRRTATTGTDGVARVVNLDAGDWTVVVVREGRSEEHTSE